MESGDEPSAPVALDRSDPDFHENGSGGRRARGQRISSNWAVPSSWIIRGRLAFRLRRVGWCRARWGGVRLREVFLGTVGGLGECRAPILGVVGKTKGALPPTF